MKNKIKIVAIFLFLTIVVFCAWRAKNTVVVPSFLSKTNALRTCYELMGTKKDIIITSLKGGLSESILYKIDSKDKSYVIRIISHHSNKDKIREVTAQIIASQEGWGPLVHASDVNEGWIIMDYIKPIPLTNTDRMSDQMYSALGKCLRCIHSGPNFLSEELIIDKIDYLLEKLRQEDKIPSVINYSRLKEITSLIRENYSTVLRPTHRDLNPNNILFTAGKPFVIDFEKAAQDDPFYDLATIGIFYIFYPYHEQVFLISYFGHKPTEQDQIHYRIMKQAALIAYGLTFLSFVPQNIIISTSLFIAPFSQVLQDIASDMINIADPADQLKIALSMLQEAINQNTKK